MQVAHVGEREQVMVLAQIRRTSAPDEASAMADEVDEQISVVQPVIDRRLMREIVPFGLIAVDLLGREPVGPDVLRDLV